MGFSGKFKPSIIGPIPEQKKDSNPKVTPTSAAPTATSPDIEAAKDSMREKRRRAAGRQDTMLTPGMLQTGKKEKLG